MHHLLQEAFPDQSLVELGCVFSQSPMLHSITALISLCYNCLFTRLQLPLDCELVQKRDCLSSLTPWGLAHCRAEPREGVQ